MAGDRNSSLVLGFTRRMQSCIGRDDVMKAYMMPETVYGVLVAGVPESHNMRIAKPRARN